MRITNVRGVVVCAAIVLGLTASVSASTISFATPSGADLSNGRAVNAQATFVTAKNSLTVTMSNLQINIKDITQTISGVSFALDNLMTGNTITSSAGYERAVHSNSTFTDGASVPTGWQILLDGQSMQLMLPDPVVSHTIIGPASGSTYPGANSSIAGDANDNPFLAGSVTFAINVPGITASTKVDWAMLHFGTCAEYVQLNPTSSVPEPATATLVVTALACAATIGWCRRKQSHCKLSRQE